MRESPHSAFILENVCHQPAFHLVVLTGHQLPYHSHKLLKLLLENLLSYRHRPLWAGLCYASRQESLEAQRREHSLASLEKATSARSTLPIADHWRSRSVRSFAEEVLAPVSLQEGAPRGLVLDHLPHQTT